MDTKEIIIEILSILGILVILAIAIIILLIPVIAILILGHYTATHYFHLNGIIYWAYLVVFYLIVGGIIGAIYKITN